MKVKFISKCFLYLIITFFLLSVLAGDGRAVYAGSTGASNKPIFSSSFIQYWYCQDFSRDRWKKELTMLKKMGINEIIIQTTADTKTKYAAYPTRIKGYSHGDVDMLENVLSEADMLSMRVRIGTGFSEDWWNKRATDKQWLNDQATSNKAIIDEIAEMYGSHPSLWGWYIPYEFCQYTAISNTQQVYLNSFYKQISSEIKLKSPYKDIMVSPYYNGKDSKTVPLPIWSLMVKKIIKKTGVDILALQDSVGVNYNTVDKLYDIFLYTRMAANSAGIRLYAVTETFKSTAVGNISASQDEISKQLAVEKEFVQGFVAFSINHYQNSNEHSQEKYSNQYYKYYLSIAETPLVKKLGRLFETQKID